jgi:cbb3-type cytochrome oxidase maturation protein
VIAAGYRIHIEHQQALSINDSVSCAARPGADPMSILFVLVPLSLALVGLGIWGFFWAVDRGQFDDMDSPAWEILREPGDE